MNTELKDLLISWAVLSFCFAFSFNVSRIIYMLPISMATVGLGFVAHEVSHRYVARKFGCVAYYRLWSWGLILALTLAVISGGRVIFAAPGAVYIVPPVMWYGMGNELRRIYAHISMAGPLANIIIAILFYFISGFGGILRLIGYIGYKINIWLAIFNLIPLPPLDGSKIFSYNIMYWGILMGASILIYIL